MENLKKQLGVFPDFPKPGIRFYDISPLLKNNQALRDMANAMEEAVADISFDCIAGIDARGFIFGTLLAHHMNKGFVMVRKAGKLPGMTSDVVYGLEYDESVLSVQQHLMSSGEKVLVVDDVLATGGTVMAAIELLEGEGAHIAGALFALEINALNGREKLKEYWYRSIINV